MTKAGPSASAPAEDDIDQDRALRAFEMMVTIRAFEEGAAAGYRSSEIPGAVHVSIGQEAIAGALSVAVRPDDALLSTHRGHGHCIAKGVSLEAVWAELLGRTTGCSGGRGGSMHMFSAEHNVLGTNGIVGPNISLAVGHALGSRHIKHSGVTVVMFGEGAAATGAFHESLQLASLWKVPVVLLCENNSFTEFTPFEDWATFSSVRSLAERYRGIELLQCDGTDLLASIDAVDRAFEIARAGGPVLLEAYARRWHGHYEGDPQRYRADGGGAGDGRDPLEVGREQLVAKGIAAEVLDEIAARSSQAVDDALIAARLADEPDPATVLDHVYAA
ncbi:MAG: acoA [Solirubrobacterales bacterium]|jgi:2-oxoisovalerate dehydrogenase E1 component|nr:acoA [Solirubrobacterales bacterium]